jgi:hypothetical protein
MTNLLRLAGLGAACMAGFAAFQASAADARIASVADAIACKGVGAMADTNRAVDDKSFMPFLKEPKTVGLDSGFIRESAQPVEAFGLRSNYVYFYARNEIYLVVKSDKPLQDMAAFAAKQGWQKDDSLGAEWPMYGKRSGDGELTAMPGESGAKSGYYLVGCKYDLGAVQQKYFGKAP